MKGSIPRDPRADGKRIPADKPSPSRQTASDDELFCPRCRNPLIDARGLGLCQACGYCRTIVEECMPRTAFAPRWLARLGLLQCWELLDRMPAWVWGVLAAVVAVLPVCHVADRRLPLDSPQRAYWSTIQLGLGLLAILAAQVWTLVYLRKHRYHLGLIDLVFPSHLWYLAFRRVPDTNGAIGLAGGGVAAMLAAVLWVGGLSYWIQTNEFEQEDEVFAGTSHKEKFQRTPLGKFVDGLRERVRKRPEEKKRVGSGPPPDPPPPVTPTAPTDPPPDNRPAVRCIITGYVLNAAGELDSLLLGTLRNGKLTGAGFVRPDLTPEARAELLKRLSAQRRANPAVDGQSAQAIWVNPVIECEVRHSGTDDQGRLVEPALKEVTAEK